MNVRIVWILNEVIVSKGFKGSCYRKACNVSEESLKTNVRDDRLEFRLRFRWGMYELSLGVGTPLISNQSVLWFRSVLLTPLYSSGYNESRQFNLLILPSTNLALNFTNARSFVAREAIVEIWQLVNRINLIEREWILDFSKFDRSCDNLWLDWP